MQNESFFELLKPDIENFLSECTRRTNEGKLKLDNGDLAICLSFHEAER